MHCALKCKAFVHLEGLGVSVGKNACVFSQRKVLSEHKVLTMFLKGGNRTMYKVRKSKEGFTIIEVLIVLAIAGLIMLIVFLAVPALQRNSRNTQIRNDAGNVLSGINEFISNNNGQLPTGIASNAAGVVTITGGGGAQQNTTNVRPGTNVANAAGFPAGVGDINVVLGQKCNGNAAFTPSSRSFAAAFRVESGSGTNPTQCVES